MNKELTFHIFADQDEETGLFFSVCLELNIVTQGKTPEEAKAGLQDAVEMYVESVMEERDYSSLFRPAPKEYWEKAFPIKPSVHLISA